MSKLMLVIYDEDADDSKIDELDSIMLRVIAKINNRMKCNFSTDIINDRKITNEDKCHHAFEVIKSEGIVKCLRCPKIFPISKGVK